MTPAQLLEHYDNASLWPEGSGLEVPAAYQRALAVRALREARGEKVRGYKIGFTNRTIWARYAVYGPIWGPVYDTTVSSCDCAACDPLHLKKTARRSARGGHACGVPEVLGRRTQRPGRAVQADLQRHLPGLRARGQQAAGVQFIPDQAGR